MLEALYEAGIRPDLLVATSAGAVNAAFVASRSPTVQTVRDLQQIWRGLRRSHVFPANPLAAGLGVLGLHDHSVSPGPLRSLVLRHLEIDRLQDAPVELHVVAADVLSGKEVLLSEGPAADAILASAAIPGVFPPVSWESLQLVDGGIVNNTPISHAVELGADRVYVLQAICTRPLGRAPRGVWASGVAGMSRAITRRFDEDLVRYSDAVELTVLPAPRPEGSSPTDFRHADELIADGLSLARAALAQAGRVMPLRLAA
ncbi:MAG: patatin-like phospholipase family protein [Solirubrobacterales bacterium]|nr:patatin-like phospholipase family protein [Solirubrobacterales bacterium]